MPATPQIATIICPKCGMTLPGRALICQFCKADLKGVQRPSEPVAKTTGYQIESWKIVAYYFIGAWWVFNGITTILSGAKILSSLLAGPGAMFSGIPAIVVIVGVVYLATGVGLLLKVELAKGIANVFSWIAILNGLLSVWACIMLGAALGPMMIVPLLMAVFNIAIAGLQIYIIGELAAFM